MLEVPEAKLKLADYRILNFSFETGSGSEMNAEEVELGVSFKLAQQRENPLNFMIKMSVVINENEAAFEAFNFRIRLEIAGLFEFTEDMSREKIDEMLLFNGLSILYGCARSVVATFTSETPLGRLMLPTLNIAEFIKETIKPRSKNKVKKASTMQKKKTS